jgi:hypothetical protein
LCGPDDIYSLTNSLHYSFSNSGGEGTNGTEGGDYPADSKANAFPAQLGQIEE